jgi:hypothetical protein
LKSNPGTLKKRKKMIEELALVKANHCKAREGACRGLRFLERE